MADQIRVDWQAMSAARRKYRQAVQEAEKRDAGLTHSLYKLGSFLDEATHGAFSADDMRFVEPGEAGK